MKLPLVAIVGRPNVGKSTLFNRLAGKKKALVQETPGVTRDLHYAEVVYNRKRFNLVDTGGISTVHTDELTAEVNEQIDFAIESADAICFLMDGKDGLTAEDEDIVERLRRVKKPVYWVINKVDSPNLEHLVYDFYRLGIEKFYPISAREKLGVETLFDDLTEFFPEPPPPVEDEESRPTFVAFVGSPNVGKSSMINRILGEKRLITSALPGTTRDAIDVPFQLHDRNFMLIDTAGIRRKGKVSLVVEKFAVVKALQALDRTDIAVVLHDATQPLTDQTLHILSYAEERGRGIILALNKTDLQRGEPNWRKQVASDLDRRLTGLEWVPVLFLSAKTGFGLNDLFETISRVRDNQLRRLATAPLNRVLEEVVTHHNPPMAHGKTRRLYYLTQTGVRPPTFVVFTNHPAGVHFSYRRYLVNRLRDADDFQGTPIRLFFKGKKKGE